MFFIENNFNDFVYPLFSGGEVGWFRVACKALNEAGNVSGFLEGTPLTVLGGPLTKPGGSLNEARNVSGFLEEPP